MNLRQWATGLLAAVAIGSPFAAPQQAFADDSPNAVDSSGLHEADGKSFSFTFEVPLTDENGVSERAFGAGACTGTFANPRLEADGVIGYGLSVSCAGTGFLPLAAKIELQEEHGGAFYRDVDSTGKVPLTEGGYGFVRGEAFCNPDEAGHDYRVSGAIYAGTHRGVGVSEEVHLPCDL